jgi:hypothetical protein
MNRYMGVKMVNAMPMTREEYNEFRGWQVPADENPDDRGFLVEYVDGGKANTEQFKGYVSWSPADVFDRSYRPIGSGMTFSMALEILKSGGRVARMGWSGRGVWLQCAPVEMEQSSSCPWIGMKTADGAIVPWSIGQSDALAEDWVVIP